jgi:hypothetical protein
MDLQRKINNTQSFVFSMQPRKQKFTESEARDDFNSPSELVEDKVGAKFGMQLNKNSQSKQACPSQ